MPTNPRAGIRLTDAVSMRDDVTPEMLERWQEEERRQQMEMEIARQSVLSEYHPANDYRYRDREENREFVYRERQPRKILQMTIGWELEANREAIKVPRGVQQIGDGSVNGDGAEYVVLPAVTKSPNYVMGMLKDLVHAPKLNTDESCGFHVHISTPKMSITKKRQWAIAVEHLAMQIEEEAFKAVPDSRKGNNYCRRINPLGNGTRFVSSKYNNDRRYHWLNTVEMFRPNGIGTIENRLLGHTHRWKYLMAWVLFTLELGQRGYALQYAPFSSENHVEHLKYMLKMIANDIKPLAKRHEPIPQWVYDGLRKFGIDSSRWDRPLATLTAKEASLKGYSVPVYSDDQPEIPSHNEDEDYCACGCGEEGRCNDQAHSDGDCDSNYCDRCHENGDCGGSPSCERCIVDRHDEGEDCGRSRCATCHPRTVSGTSTGRVRVTASNNPDGSISVRPSPSTVQAIQNEVDAIRNVRIDNQALQANLMSYVVLDEASNDAMFYGASIVQNLWTDAGMRLLDDHEQALSAERERIISQGCGPSCTLEHWTDCLRCGRDWGYHSGHNCHGHDGRTIQRGSFRLEGGR